MSGKPVKPNKDKDGKKLTQTAAGAPIAEKETNKPKDSKETKEKKITKPDTIVVKASSCWLEAFSKIYSPGQTVELVAHVNLKRKFTTVFAVIEGLVKAEVNDSAGCRTSSQKLFDGFEYLLNSPAPGLYSIPLSFTLPHQSPNSFEYSHLRNSLSVDYTIKIHADDEILVLSKLVVYKPFMDVPNYPKTIIEKKSFKEKWYSLKDSVVAFNMEVDTKTYRYGDSANFSIKSSSRELKTRKKQIYGALFMIITGKGPLAGFQLMVPRNETKSSSEEYPLNFEVPITPSFIEQPTDTSLFKVDYGVGVLVDQTGMYGIQPILIVTPIAVPDSLYYSDTNETYNNEISIHLKAPSATA
jgi:hypothetical protein